MLQEKRGWEAGEAGSREILKNIYLKMGQITACVDADKDGTVEGKRNSIGEKTRTAGTVSLDCSNRAEFGHFWWSRMGFVVVSKAAITKYHQLGGLNNGDSLFLSAGGYKSKVMVSPGLVSSEICEGETVSKLSPNFWWFVGNLDHFLACRHFTLALPPCSHDILPVCLSVNQISFCVRTPVVLN